MAIAHDPRTERYSAILDHVAAELARRGVAVGGGAGAGQLQVKKEEEVRRIIQAYWTPFQATIPGRSVGLHLNVDQPTKHWAEGYISPESDSWIFCFHERSDGQYQLAYYRQQKDPRVAVKEFFDLAAWYTLTPCDLTWKDVVCTIDPDSGWTERHVDTAASAGELDKSIQESIKKSTIAWLRWKDDEGTERTMPIWFINQDNKLYVVSGERQQTIPNARSLRRAEVILRWKGRGNARVAELPASVRVLEHGPEWDAIAEKLAEKRLNTPGAPEDLARRWRDECDILELTL